jgi:hypothetical protein
MQQQRAYFGCLQIRNSALCHYLIPAEPIERSKRQIQNEFNLLSTYSGEISKLAKKNISRAIQLLLQGSPMQWYTNPITGKRNHHRLTFITLTFSCQKIVSLREEYKKSLLPFLRWLKEVQKVVNYVWKAEYQKRGQLHYHITTNKFIAWTEIRNKWNYIQKQNGYLQEYFAKKKSYDANSTDVHAVYKIQDIESYLCKYMMKSVISENEEDNLSVNQNQVKGKVWGCSENLRGKKYYTLEYVREEIIEAIEEQNKIGAVKKIESIDSCQFWKIQNKKDFTTLFHSSVAKDIQAYAMSEFKTTNEFFNNQNK